MSLLDIYIYIYLSARSAVIEIARQGLVETPVYVVYEREEGRNGELIDSEAMLGR